MVTNNTQFDPTSLGAKPVQGAFDPTSVGAKPFDGSQNINNAAAVLGPANNINAVQRDATGKATPEQMDQFNQEDQQATNTADEANSPAGIAQETAKGTVNSLVSNGAKFIKSAIAAPIDIVRSMFGMDPISMPSQDINGNPITTIQEDANQNTKNVMDGTMTPIQATGQAVGDTVSGAADVLGAGEGLSKLTGVGSTELGSLTSKGLDMTAGKQAVKNAVSDVKNIGSDISNPFAKDSTKLVSSTEDTMTKSERMQAMNEGRLQTTKTGAKEYLPSTAEKNAGQILDGKLTGNPVKDTNIVRDEIATRGQEAEKYLEQNAKPISNKEDYNAFQKVRTQSNKYMTKTEMSAYDEQVGTFQKILKDQVKGKGYTTDNYYKALKDYESNVADHLPKGKARLLDPTGIANAKVRAASDVRTVVRDMIGNKNPEFKPKMFDLASLYEAKGNLMAKADNLEGNTVSRFLNKPVIKTTAKIAAGGAALKEGYNVLTGKGL